MSILLRKFQQFKKIFFLDKNEKKYINIFREINKNNLPKKSEVIFVNIAMDYEHLSNASFILQTKKFKNAVIIGIWNYNIHSCWKSNYFLENAVILKNLFKIYFLKKKWVKIYKSIGVQAVIDTSSASLLDKNKYKKKAKNIVNLIKKEKKEKILKLTMNNILIGDLVIDTFIRFRNTQRISVDDFFLKEIIKKFLISKNNIDKAIKKFKPKCIFLSHSNYSAGVVARVAVNKKIDVFCTGDQLSYLKKLSKNDTSSQTGYENFKSSFKKVNLKKQKIRQASIELNKRFLGNHDSSYQNFKTHPYKVNSKKLKFRTKGVLFLHDFFDSPHHIKSMFFLDFYEWAIFTLNIIKQYNLDIAVKPHPNSIYQNKIIVEELKKKFPEIKWINSDVTNTEIFKSGIKFGISVYGTVLYELAYKGLVAIASTPYHPSYNYDIVYTPKNKSQYKNLLINSHKLKFKNNTKSKIEEFYYMFTFYNHDALPETGRLINLKSINYEKSKSLIEYLKKLSIYKKEKSNFLV